MTSKSLACHTLLNRYKKIKNIRKKYKEKFKKISTSIATKEWYIPNLSYTEASWSVQTCPGRYHREQRSRLELAERLRHWTADVSSACPILASAFVRELVLNLFLI